MSERNGRIVVLIDPGRRHGMEDLFYDWGILVDDMTIQDDGPDYRSQGGDLIIRRFAEHPITKLLVDYQVPYSDSLVLSVQILPHCVIPGLK